MVHHLEVINTFHINISSFLNYLRQKTLGQQLLRPAPQLDVQQAVVRFPDLRVPERAQAKLDHRPVVKDLSRRVSMGHAVLQVGHEHEVPGLVPVVVDSVVVNVAEDGPGSKPVGGVLGVDVLAQPVHDLEGRLLGVLLSLAL